MRLSRWTVALLMGALAGLALLSVYQAKVNIRQRLLIRQIWAECSNASKT